MRRTAIVVLSAVLVLGAAPAAEACGGLIGPNGNVNLLRTTTLAGWADGVEHYVTSFDFAGGGGAFGSLVPLPGVPTSVERGGDWTLQRLIRETQPPVAFARSALAAADGAAEKAEVLLETRIDALDLTVLRGGGDAVGVWAKENGFALPPDAPEVLDFYAARSPIFLAARFDADAAAERGQNIGEGTPIHLTIPTDNPWVPLRILALGKQEAEIVNADVYLLTPERPSILPLAKGLNLERSEQASESLIADLRADKGGEWIPQSGMWLSFIRIDARAGDLDFDLAVDVGGRSPSMVDAGIEAPPVAPSEPPAPPGLPLWMLAGVAALVAALGIALGRGLVRRAPA